MNATSKPHVGELACAVCGALGSRTYRKKAEACYYRCPACGALFQHPVPDRSAVQGYANVEYEHGAYREYVQAREMKLEHFRRRVAIVSRFARGRSLLDAGCSCGYFLEVAAAEGYDVRGVEFSSNAIAAARPEIRNRIRRGHLEDLCAEGMHRFDVVTAFDIIEHLERPVDFLRQARQALQPGGILVVTTPDAGHWLGRLMGSRWPMLQPMQHLTIFSRRALRLALEEAGFQVAVVETAHKVVSAEYLLSQIQQLNPVVHTVLRAAARLVPRSSMARYRDLSLGEILAVGVNDGPSAR
jgi:2-polyprenyl-3-methyl-5-hydroxy-6-metoxy-1,4-benzoquinol methylase